MTVDLDAATEAQDWVALLVRAEVAAKREGLAGRERVLAERDPQIRKALESFDMARQLADLGRTSLVPDALVTDVR